MPRYLFILGTASSLCREEILAVLNTLKISFSEVYFQEKVFHIETSQGLDCVKLMNILGGTVKIAKVEAQTSYEDDLAKTITSRLDTNSKRVIFGLSWVTINKQTNHFNAICQLSKKVKNALEQSGIKCRFVLPQDREQELSSVVIEKQKVQEIIVCEEDKQLMLAKTVIVQKFEEWNKRDYQRPVVAPDLGMLPPKVARMMVNIAQGHLQAKNDTSLKLLDPFCGMGTILAEAMLLHMQVVGCDLEPKAINGTQNNLDWLSRVYELPKNYTVHLCDATHLSQKVPNNSIDLIVTEPYLGPLIDTPFLPRGSQVVRGQSRTKNGKLVTPGFIERIVDGLERLYIGCLKDWHDILTNNGIVAIVLPSYLFEDKEFFVKKVIDNSTKLGYSIEVGPLPYSRPQAIVKRNIFILKKSK